eukprot:PhF_6_TR37182/c0_g1_i1/m.54773
MIVSIDLGTDKVMAFSWSSSDRKPRSIPTAKHPSIIALRRTLLIGKEAEKERRPNALNFSDSILSAIFGGLSENILLRYQTEYREYTLETCLAFLLVKLKESLLDDSGIQLNTLSLVVLVVPSGVTVRGRLLVKKAAAIAGIKNAAVASSGLCSSLYYYDYFSSLPPTAVHPAVREPSQIQRLAIVDLGAGFTSATDVSVCFDPPKVVVSRTLSTPFGGRAVDRIIQNLIPGASMQQCEKAKRDLTTSNVVSVDIVSTQQRVALLRSDFESSLETVVRASVVPLLSQVFQHKDSIDSVVMLGGTSRVPVVGKIVREFFSKTCRVESLDVDYGTGLGGALLGAVWASKVPGLNVQDLSVLSTEVNGVSWEHGIGIVSGSKGHRVGDTIVLSQQNEDIGSVMLIGAHHAEVVIDREGLLSGDLYAPPPNLVDASDVVGQRAVVMAELETIKEHAAHSAARNELEGHVFKKVSASTPDGMRRMDSLIQGISFAKKCLEQDSLSTENFYALARTLSTIQMFISNGEAGNTENVDAAISFIDLMKSNAEKSVSDSLPTTAVSPGNKSKPKDATDAYTRTYTLFTPERKSFDMAKVRSTLAFHKENVKMIVEARQRLLGDSKQNQSKQLTTVDMRNPNLFARSYSAPSTQRQVVPQLPLSRPTGQIIEYNSRQPTLLSQRGNSPVRSRTPPSSSTARRAPPPITITNPNTRGSSIMSQRSSSVVPKKPSVYYAPPQQKRLPKRPNVTPTVTTQANIPVRRVVRTTPEPPKYVPVLRKTYY